MPAPVAVADAEDEDLPLRRLSIQLGSGMCNCSAFLAHQHVVGIRMQRLCQVIPGTELDELSQWMIRLEDRLPGLLLGGRLLE